MERFMLICRLKPNARPAVEELLEAGPPFDLEQSGFCRHGVYLSQDDVVFMFEADDAGSLAEQLVYSPFHWMLSERMEEWRGLVEEPQRARERFFWQCAPELEGAV